MNTLFPPHPLDICHALEVLPRALDKVLPLKPAHKRALPLAIEELSKRLTSERNAPLPYWSAPRLTAAYVWYFLPWNLLRLTRLLRGLDIPPPTQARIWADMGSGPLTLPIALWLARPEWRETPLTVLCMDTAPHPLELGRRLFTAIAPNSCWRIVTRRAPIDALRRELASLSDPLWLISAANVCNELKGRSGEHVFQRLDALITQTAPLLNQAHNDNAGSLFVEPGTRLGGKTITALREAALGHIVAEDFIEEDDTKNPAPSALLRPASPCPHTHVCPLRTGRTWCHFRFDTGGAPAWLEKLAREAQMPKTDLSLAFVHLRSLSVDTAQGAESRGRVLSDAFFAPGVQGHARYACTARGLALLEKALQAPQGALVNIIWPQEMRRDAKSGAWIAEWNAT